MFAPSWAVFYAEFPVRESEALEVEEVPKVEEEAILKAYWIARTVELAEVAEVVAVVPLVQ